MAIRINKSKPQARARGIGPATLSESSMPSGVGTVRKVSSKGGDFKA